MRAGQFKWCLLCAVSACTGLSVGNTPVAIEFGGPPPPTIKAGDTITLTVRALDRAGDSVAATIRLLSLNPDTLGIDSSRLPLLRVYGVLDTVNLKYPATGRIVATTGNLQSLPLSITVTAP